MVKHMHDVLASWRAERPASDDPLARLQAFISFHVRHHATKQKEVFIGSMEMRSLSPRERQIVADLRGDYESELKSILEDGIKCRLFTIVDVRVATFLPSWAMLTGLTAWYREEGRLSKAALVKCYVDLVSNGVGAAKPDRSRR
jgi:hypothetical protein